MPTIGDMVRSTSLAYKMSASGSRIFGNLGKAGSSNSLLGASAASAGTSYINSVLGSRNSLNSIVSDYKSGKASFKAEFTDKMNSLRNSAYSLKNLGAGKNGTGGTSAGATGAKKTTTGAANSISSFMSSRTGMGASARNELNTNLGNIRRFAANRSSMTASDKQANQQALGRVKNIMENQMGVTQKESKDAKDAAHKVSATADNFQSIRGRVSGNTSDPMSRLEDYVNGYRSDGVVSDGVASAVKSMENAFTEVSGLYSAIDTLASFGSSYRMDAATEVAYQAAMAAVQSFGDSYRVSDATMTAMGTAISTMKSFADGAEVSDEAIGEALATFQQFTSEYQSLQAPSEGELSTLRDAARNISEITADAAAPFEDLAVLQETAEDSEEAATVPDDIKQTVGAIQDFVKEFNSTMSYLNENREISGRFAAVASSFGDNGYFAKSLDRIGISVGKDGALAVDEAKLTKALSESPSAVDAVLGKDGLAGRLDRKIDMASSQADRLFPALNNFLGGQRSVEATKAMYSGHTLSAMSKYTSAGDLLNMFS